MKSETQGMKSDQLIVVGSWEAMTRQMSRLRPAAPDFLLRYASADKTTWQADGSRLRQAPFAKATASQGLRRAEEVGGEREDCVHISKFANARRVRLRLGRARSPKGSIGDYGRRSLFAGLINQKRD